MSYAELQGLLKLTMGLDVASIGSSALERAVQARMSACATSDLPVYAEHARTSKAEAQALIEAIVVPETWFFRDREALTALTRLVREEWLPAHPQSVLRLLSLPCSSGEEPYSMAMALMDAGISTERYRIDAIDISAAALTSARRARYGRNSFRGPDLSFRKLHFEATTNGYRLHRRVREQVNFHQANLLDPTLSARVRAYDFVFCRNLLIYFDRDTQDRAVKTLRTLLADRGVLFVGPSEAALLLNHEFVSVKMPLAFAFRLAPTPPSAGTLAAPASGRDAARALPLAAHPLLLTAEPVTAGNIDGCLCGFTVRQDASADSGIDAARRLADQGRLEEAANCCEQQLLRYGPSAQVYCLMGVIRAATGEVADAEQCFRKAVYLDPKHYDALLHLALLLEKRGSRAEAHVLRARISRLEPQVAEPHEH